MLHDLIYGMLIGYGAAVPIGPMNLELIRRNLTLGTPAGVAFGLGACLVDATFVILLFCGASVVLKNPVFIKMVAFFGSLILIWFGINALRTKPVDTRQQPLPATPQKTLWRHTRDSYLLTMVNPFTLLFWSSVSSQAVLLIQTSAHPLISVAGGVLLATLSWILGLNAVLHFTRSKFSLKTLRAFNIAGGVILLGFAGYGLVRLLIS